MATGQEIADRVAKGIAVLAAVGKTEQELMPYAMFIAGFFPGAASVLSAIAIAQPYINRVVAAAPAVAAAVEAGAPIIQAMQDSGPDVLAHAKAAIAIMTNHDPAMRQAGLQGEDISDQQVAQAFAPILIGRPWTEEEQNRWFDRASGQANF